MRTKTFDKPHSHDAEWYKDREAVDHINQAGHIPRLYNAYELLEEIMAQEEVKTITDFGCGNGGLMRKIKQNFPSVEIWGYDLCPANVQDAKDKGSDVELVDFVLEENLKYPEAVICTEVLEHLVDPDAFLKKLLDNGVKYVIASSPNYETPTSHEEYHLWVFQGNSYADMFTEIGWEVIKHEKSVFQFVVAKRKD
jgi:2-polyprenyl-3-methyl-5-hydroxy-6-metoxy-1,4-benzoquinol methylase